MRIRERQDILQDVIGSDDDPDGWRAAGGDRAHGLGEDLYFGHPSVGVYLIKTYARNPYTVEGIGTRVARRLDDEIGSILSAEQGMRLAVQSAPADAEEAESREAPRGGRNGVLDAELDELNATDEGDRGFQ